MNPYDPCVSNQMVNWWQQSILFHVDYCNLIQKGPKVNASFVGVPHNEYNSIFEDGSSRMKVNNGKVHNYIGMTLNFT